MSIRQFSHTRAGALLIVVAVFFAGYVTAKINNSETEAGEQIKPAPARSTDSPKHEAKTLQWRLI